METTKSLNTVSAKKTGIFSKKIKAIKKNWELYLFLLPTLVYFLVFHYLPMYGVQIAFKDYIAVEGIWGSPWVGFEHFERFFNSYQFGNILSNTLLINLYELLFDFPAAIILALLINQLTKLRFKKLVQTVTYAPHFISVVVLVGMINLILSPQTGFVNNLITMFGGEPIYFMGESGWFKPLFVLSEIWQTTGWNTIIFLAALTAVSPNLHEAAIMDGANKWQRIRHIDLPSIMPIIMILLILQIGNFMTLGYQKVLLMQNDLNIASSEVIQTYVYKAGILNSQYSFSAAVGLFNNVINFILLIVMNQFAKKTKQQSLF